MPTLSLKVSHALTQQEALTRIQRFLPQLKSQHFDKIYDLEETWSGNTGSFKFKLSGFKVSGTVVVEEYVVIITWDLPFLTIPFKSLTEDTIWQQVEAILK